MIEQYPAFLGALESWTLRAQAALILDLARHVHADRLTVYAPVWTHDGALLRYAVTHPDGARIERAHFVPLARIERVSAVDVAEVELLRRTSTEAPPLDPLAPWGGGPEYMG